MFGCTKVDWIQNELDKVLQMQSGRKRINERNVWSVNDLDQCVKGKGRETKVLKYGKTGSSAKSLPVQYEFRHSQSLERQVSASSSWPTGDVKLQNFPFICNYFSYIQLIFNDGFRHRYWNVTCVISPSEDLTTWLSHSLFARFISPCLPFVHIRQFNTIAL